MKTLAISICFCLVNFCTFAQDATIKALKSDQQINEVFTTKDLFRYHQFMQGKVYLRDGTTAEARLNYNKLFEQFLFIDPKGDSLAIAEPETIRFITLETDTFYFENGNYLELIGHYNDTKLARKQTLKEIDQQKNGAYGQTYTNNSSSANKHYYTVDGTPKLNVGESTLFAQLTQFFVSSKNGEFLAVTRKNIEKQFPGKSKIIRDFIRDNGIDLSKEESLKKLLSFIQK